jgi:hypothetical protein
VDGFDFDIEHDGGACKLIPCFDILLVYKTPNLSSNSLRCHDQPSAIPLLRVP